VQVKGLMWEQGSDLYSSTGNLTEDRHQWPAFNLPTKGSNRALEEIKGNRRMVCSRSPRDPLGQHPGEPSESKAGVG
jgi:hypothetical protein